MKKALLILISLLMLISMAACTSQKNFGPENNNPNNSSLENGNEIISLDSEELKK